MEEDTDNSAQEAQDQLDQIKESQENNNGSIDDHFIIRFLRDRLKLPCLVTIKASSWMVSQNAEARDLFISEEEGGEGGARNYNKRIMPKFVICLEATDDFLKNRVMTLPESVVNATHNTEKELIRRLLEYRTQNSDDETVLNYFDELEFHPEKN
ncbi:adenylate kinase 7-like [Biomphalaria glabrata]|uniref:Adenylate kinase 7-like n=1 Tax=Biomphalaria glabrata TaxID=6526 RepID=A0A9W3BIM8_BIOGL|nr:adenylate kinase 7-like [Biomphalaria glabrata]